MANTKKAVKAAPKTQKVAKAKEVKKPVAAAPKTKIENKTQFSKKVLFIAGEAVPFIKTGGLADVAGALP